jgi:NAD dependent epimerase/dehydratase family enzyme
MFNEIERIFQDYYFNIIIIGVENVCRTFNLPQNSWKIPKPAPLLIGSSAVELLSSQKIISSAIKSSYYTYKYYTIKKSKW